VIRCRASSALGKYESAAEENRKGIQMDPDDSIEYANLASDYLYLGHLPDAENALRRAAARKLDMPDFLLVRYMIAFVKGELPQMERLAALGEQNPELTDWMRDKEASVLAYSGRLKDARVVSQRGIDLAQSTGRREAAAQLGASAAMRESLFGNQSEARHLVATVHRSPNWRDADYGIALAAALAGDSSATQKTADELTKRFPGDTLVKFSYVPALRAVVALNRREPEKAILLLQTASPCELGFQGANTVGFAGSLYPIYVRGEALLMMRRGPEAAAEFQKILDHQGIVFSDPVGALSRLQLGRAFALAGDQMRAKAAYDDFLGVWRNADPNIPILRQAKGEYNHLSVNAR
jgi:eukaryotic-like serine/threonine-protein kinase